MAETEALEWAVKSAEFAFNSGINVVSLIPTRPGNGALDRLMEARDFCSAQAVNPGKGAELSLEIADGGRVLR